MSQYVTVPGWRRKMQALHGLGQDEDISSEFGLPSGSLTADYNTPAIFPTIAPYSPDLSSTASAAPSDESFESELDSLLGTPSASTPTAPSSPLYDVFGQVGGPSSATPLQTVNWGNGVTGTYDSLTNTYYDSNGNELNAAQLSQYGAFTMGGPASGTSSGIASIGSGIASAISKIFAPSPSAGVPARPGVATASISPSLGSSLSSLLLPIAAIAAIALVVKRR